jgi:hypothetical protein
MPNSIRPNLHSSLPSQPDGELIRTFRSLIDNPPHLPAPMDEASRLEEFLVHGFNSSATVFLMGNLDMRIPKTVRVNASRQIHLDRRRFIVLLVLAWYARFWTTLPEVERSTRSSYLTASRILDYIDELKTLYAMELPVFRSGDALDVTDAISQFRKALRAEGQEAGIIETGPGHYGYRWSLPARNLILRFAPTVNSV